MLWRISSFLVLLVLGALIGARLGSQSGAMLGTVAASVTWFVLDLLRGLRAVRWLRRPEASEPPAMAGLWGEVVERARRALRVREQQTVQAEMRLQEFLAAIQASPNGVVLLDSEGHIEWCNLTAAGHLGFDPQRDMMQLVGNLVRDPAFAAYQAGGDFERDVVITGRASTPSRPCRISVRLHPYGEGRRLLLSRDVTSLEQAEAMRRDFVANVSHEIRTPLTVLAGFIETLQNLSLEARERERYLALMAQQAQRMQSLVNDLLTLSRLEGSPPPGAGGWVTLESLMAQCEGEARGLAQALGRHHALHFLPVPALELAVMPNEVLSALSNLVGNAIRYTPAGQAIDVEWLRLADGSAAFRVRDTGPGIAPEHLPRLTERFYRVDRSRSRETGGTGLGLAIVKHVAQRHGGELRIESTPGTGSAFTLLLPAVRVRERVTPGVAAQPATAAS
jgi:two-component system, OmpR family, phosphate regulon sensor histidine kinase PhoR